MYVVRCMTETRKALPQNNKKNLNKTLTDLCYKDLVVDISNNIILEVSGANAKNFLQGQISCDLNQITETQSSLAASCTNKGRVIGIFRVLKYDDRYLLLLQNTNSKALLEHLSKYAPLSRVDVRSYPHLSTHHGISGQHLDQYFSEPAHIPKELNQVSHTNECIIIKIPGPQCRYEILATSEKSLANILRIDQLSKQALNVWNALDYLIALPNINAETTAAYTPHMLNLKQHGAISFSKGCYVGQEVIARTEHLGKAKRCLLPAVIDKVAEYRLGEEILDMTGKKVGEILNTVSIKDLQVLLVIIEKSALESKLFLHDHELNGLDL